MNNNKKNSDQSSDAQDIQIARLAFIGASIVTLGDLISTLAAGLALDALEKSKNGDSGPPPTQSKDMQKQLDYLINEFRQIKKIM
ncbi:translation initiation factor 2 [Solibacillus sp. FSL W8-0372]|uniref:translation initiation factor 2 n=1 Tax=Solibacillus sp. FSL W8-0372 TaxID=2921713 RepID=UPI0030D0ED96